MLLPARIAQGVRDGAVTLAFRRWEQPRVKPGGTQLTSAGIVAFEAVAEVLDPADLTEADARAAGFADLAALRRQLWPPPLPEERPRNEDASRRVVPPERPGNEGALAPFPEERPRNEEPPPPFPEERPRDEDASRRVVPPERPGNEGALAPFPEERPRNEEPPPPLPEERPRNEDASRRGRPRGPRASKGGDHVYRVTLAWVGDDPRVALRDEVPDLAGLAVVTAAVARLDAGRRSGAWTRPVLEWIRDHPGVISTELAALLGREVPPLKADIRRLKALGLTESLRVGYRLSPRGRAYLESLG